ncbi:MAG: hemin receptor [Alphaproteobacteria bacterium]|nr:hemin receptor [Alphaproteobacteria bacterium]
MSMKEDDLAIGIGPHEGRELDLLLAGEKPAARFRLDGLSEEYEDRFREAVERGDIVEFDFPDPDPQLHRRFYCLHGEEWRVKVMDLIDRLLADRTLTGFSEDDLHRLDGTLLGYDKCDIDLFIERTQSRRT